MHDTTSSAAQAAEGELREALAIGTTLALRPLTAHCRVGLARAYQCLGKQHDAREHVMSAITMYREMEMPFWAGRAQALLAALD